MGRVRPLDFAEVFEPLTLKTAILQRDRQRLDYCAEVDGKVILRAERASDLERAVARALRRGEGLAWRRVLVVERAAAPRFRSRALRREGFYASATVAIARGEAALRSDGVQLYRAWPPDELDEDLPAGLVPEDTRIVSLLDPGRSEVTVRPYSEGAFRALCGAALAIERCASALATAETTEEIKRAFDLRAFFAQLQKDAQPRPSE